MKKEIFLWLCCALLSSICSGADVQFGNKATIHFASGSEGRKVLTAKDEFVRQMSPFDRSSRLKTDKPVTEAEYLAFIGKNVTEWSTEERQGVESALTKIAAGLRDWSLPFPATIQLIRTTGAEEGKAAYTRGTAVMIPKAELGKGPDYLTRLICHELFHVLSRQNPGLRDELYAAIGFTRCEDLEFPRELTARKITNPDAPRNDHFIRLAIDGQTRPAIPILLSRTEIYDITRRREFFEYLELKFVVVDLNPGSGGPKVIYEKSDPKLVELKAVSGFFEQVGRNTEYIIHPEEILADNFALLVLGKQGVQSPEVLEKMRAILARITKH